MLIQVFESSTNSHMKTDVPTNTHGNLHMTSNIHTNTSINTNAGITTKEY